MKDKFGVIFIDKEELIIQLYERPLEGNLVKIYSRLYDFATFSTKKTVTPGEIIEIIAQTAISKEAINVLDWKICSREVPEVLVSQISYATNIKAEILTLTREQNLICNGLAQEF
jgi:hypothetical protein